MSDQILMPEREIRSLSLEFAQLRVKNSDKGPIIHGYAAVFNRASQDLGGFVEVIAPKAFENCLKRCDIRALMNHDPNYLLGRTKSGTLRLAEDDGGLAMEIEPPDTPMAAHVVRSIERGDMDGSSFSFTTASEGVKWDFEADPVVRNVNEIRDLFDVGPVTYPAYLDSTAAMRSMERSRPPDPRIKLSRQRLRALCLFAPYLKG